MFSIDIDKTLGPIEEVVVRRIIVGSAHTFSKGSIEYYLRPGSKDVLSVPDPTDPDKNMVITTYKKYAGAQAELTIYYANNPNVAIEHVESQLLEGSPMSITTEFTRKVFGELLLLVF